MNDISEIIYLRNQLASGEFTKEDKLMLEKIKQKILKLDTPFKEIITSAINNCEEDIKKADLKSAAQEIQLIHNIPCDIFSNWNEEYFYKIELLSYIEQIENIERIKKLIFLLAKLPKMSE